MEISYRKPGPNNIVGGVLIIPAEQVRGEYFSYRSADGKAVAMDVPIDITAHIVPSLKHLAETIGIPGAKKMKKPELLEILPKHLRIEKPGDAAAGAGAVAAPRAVAAPAAVAAPRASPKKADVYAMTVAELKEFTKSRGLKGYSKFNREELAAFIAKSM